MPTAHLTDALVRRLEPPATGNRITYDSAVTGFGARVTANGAKAYVLTYSVRGSGRQRRYTIGGCDRWTASDARRRAKELKAEIDQGADPLADIKAEREAPTMADLIERFEQEHLPRKRETTVADYRLMLKTYVVPHFGEHRKVADITFADIDALHRRITKAGHPYRSNRVLSLLSKMFALSIKWGMRNDNPCRGIERNTEYNRERYLSADELARLTKALAESPDKDVADAIRLLLFSGARKNEVLTMKWADVDLTAGTWKKPANMSKTKKANEVELSAPARMLLVERMGRKADGEEYVFPGRGNGAHHGRDIWHTWRKLCKAADISDLRIHDLRHSFASELVSAGYSLPMIGSLLGHRNVQTTARYSHLYRDARREAVERVGAVVTNAGKEAPPPTPIRRGRS
jgi:integrase